MRNPNPEQLCFIGEAHACAMATEYLKKTELRVEYETLLFERYVCHPRHQSYAGQYTDDTEMSCAVARVLIAHPPPYTKLEFADAFVAEFIRGGKREGYNQGFYSVLKDFKNGDDFLRVIEPDSDKNGAAMRAMPIGVLPRIEDVLAVATLQATVTHDTPEGRFSARAVALMSHFTLYEDGSTHRNANFKRYLQAHLPSEDKQFFHLFTYWRGPVTNKPIPVSLATVGAVYHVLTSNPTLMPMLRHSIKLRGDTDSVAAIVWGIASAIPTARNAPRPAFLERDLEKGDPRTGIVYLRELGEQLMRAYA